MLHVAILGRLAGGGGSGPRRPPPRTKWTRRVPHPVLIGHAASLTRPVRGERPSVGSGGRRVGSSRGNGKARGGGCGASLVERAAHRLHLALVLARLTQTRVETTNAPAVKPSDHRTRPAKTRSEKMGKDRQSLVLLDTNLKTKLRTCFAMARILSLASSISADRRRSCSSTCPSRAPRYQPVWRTQPPPRDVHVRRARVLRRTSSTPSAPNASPTMWKCPASSASVEAGAPSGGLRLREGRLREGRLRAMRGLALRESRAPCTSGGGRGAQGGGRRSPRWVHFGANLPRRKRLLQSARGWSGDFRGPRDIAVVRLFARGCRRSPRREGRDRQSVARGGETKRRLVGRTPRGTSQR